MSSKYGGVPVEPAQVSRYGGIPSKRGVGFKPAMFAPFEAALQVGSGAVAEPVSGIIGLLSTLVPGAPPAGNVVRDVKDAMTYEPRTVEGRAMIPNLVEGVINATPELIKKPIREGVNEYSELERWTAENYGPAAGAAIATLPTAILEAIPAGLAIRKMRLANSPAPQQARVSPLPETPAAQQYQELASGMRSGNVAAIAPAVEPDDQILKDAATLGIDLNPSHYSTNRAYIDMEQALKSRPGSLLQTVEERAIIDLGNKADELIDSLGGAQDKSSLDASLFDNFNNTIGELNTQSDSLYEKVNQAIPRATRVDPQNTRSFIDTQLADLGGDESLLTSAEKDLLRLVKNNPTYAGIDRVRRDIGSAIGQRSGPFKDDDIGQLKRLYEVLSADQQGFADAFGVGDVLKDAQSLIVQRKRLEEQAIALFGREAQSSIIPKLRQSAVALTQGDISKLNSMMSAVPEPLRQDVAATLLNDMFSAGARRNAPIGQGFVTAYSALNRNSGAKQALFQHLPPGAEERFDMIGRVATGIYRAKALENTSRTARDIISALDSGGWLSRMYGVGKRIAAAEGISTAIGMPGAGTAGVIGSVLTKTATPATKAADELLTSPAFKDAVVEAAVGNGAAQRRLLNSPEYNAWLDAQNPSVKAEVTAMGFIPWLTSPSETQRERPVQ